MFRRRGASSLTGALTRSFALFALTLAIIFVGAYALWSTMRDQAFSSSDPTVPLGDTRLATGDYAGIVQGYGIGDDVEMAVMDLQGAMVFQSDGWSARLGSYAALTADELACIPEYDDSTWVSYTTTIKDGKIFYQVNRHIFDEQGTGAAGGGGDAGDTASAAVAADQPDAASTASAANPFDTASVTDAALGATDDKIIAAVELDEDLTVVSGDLGDGKTSYTAREFALLTGSAPLNGLLCCHRFVSDTGQELAALTYAYFYTGAHYEQLAARADIVWLGCVPLIAVAAGILVWHLSRRIRQPLVRLEAAIDDLAQGRPVHASSQKDMRELGSVAHKLEQAAGLLDEARCEQARLTQERQKMVADISHDLRTPLTVIAGYARALADGTVPEQDRQSYLATIQTKCDLLANLVENLHEYSALEHPDFSLKLAERDICELMRTYLGTCYDEIDNAGFLLDVNIPDEPLPCNVDAFELTRVFNNLVGNALKYNPAGTTLLVTVEKLGASQALITLADNGVGMTAQQRAHMFEPFWRADAARTGSGSGLGLTVVARIVEEHGGTVRVDDPHDGWSTVLRIALPLASGEAGTPPQTI